MKGSNVPRRLALVGVGVGLAFMAMWWYQDTYNFFHLPTEEQADKLESYTAPPLYWFFGDVTFLACPGSAITILAKDLEGTQAFVIAWLVAVLLNGAIYYGIGLIIAALTMHLRAHKEQRSRGHG